MTTSSATIFVGCGGSGISTLRRFNSLIAEDTEWRKRADTDIFYMLFDFITQNLRLSVQWRIGPHRSGMARGWRNGPHLS